MPGVRSRQWAARCACGVALLGLMSLSTLYAADPLRAESKREWFDQATHAEEPGSPFTLEQCVGLTVAVHPKLADAAGRIDELHGLAYQAGLPPNPRLDNGNPQFISGGFPSTVTNVGLTQEIVVAGKLRLDRAAVTEARRQSEWEMVQKRFDIITDVRQAFFSSLAAQERLALLQRLAEIARQSETTSQNLFKAEQVSETDLLLLRVERRKVESAVQSATATLKGRRKELAATMGLPSLRIEAVTGQLDADVPAFDDEAVLLEVIENNPVVQIARIDVNRALLVLRRAEVEPIPNVTAQAGYQKVQVTPRDQLTVGVYVNIPLWNRNQGGIAAASAGVRRSAAQREMVVSELTRQLVMALAQFRAASQEVRNYQEGVLPDAQKTLELVQAGYARGQFDIPRLLQTQRSLFEANIEYISALENRLNSAAEIAGLLQLDEFPPVPTPPVPPGPE